MYCSQLLIGRVVVGELLMWGCIVCWSLSFLKISFYLTQKTISYMELFKQLTAAVKIIACCWNSRNGFVTI